MSLSTGDIPKTTIIDDTVDDELLRASGVTMDDTTTEASPTSLPAAAAAPASAAAPAKTTSEYVERKLAEYAAKAAEKKKKKAKSAPASPGGDDEAQAVGGGGGGGGGGGDEDVGAMEVTDEKSIVWDKDESAAAEPESKNHKSIAFWTGLALDHLRTVGEGKGLEEIKQIDLAALIKKAKFFAPGSHLYSDGRELFVRFSDCVKEKAFKNTARVTAALLMNVAVVLTSPRQLPIGHKWRQYTMHEIRKRVGTPIQDDDCPRLVYFPFMKDKGAPIFGDNWYIPVEAIFRRLKFSAAHDGYGKGKKEGRREVLDDAPFGRLFEDYSGYDENSDVSYGPLRHFFGCLSQFSGPRLKEAFCSANEAAATGDESAESYNSEALFLIAQTIRAYKHEVSKKTNAKRAREEDGDAKAKSEKDEDEAPPAKKPRKANGKKAKDADPNATETEKDDDDEEPEPKPKAKARPKPKVKAKPKAGTDADGDVDMEPESKAKDAEAKPKPKPKAQPAAAAKSADDAKWQEDLAKAKADKEAKAEAADNVKWLEEALAKAKADKEAKAKPAAEAAAKAKAQAEAAAAAAKSVDNGDEALITSLFTKGKGKANAKPKAAAAADEDADTFG